MSDDATTRPLHRPGPVAPGEGALPVVPGYEVLRQLGRGGMGVVYLARDVQLGRLVALKMVLAGAHADPADLLRFESEARAVATLRHPGIVQLYESGESGGSPYLTFEYLPGGTLEQRVRHGPLPPVEAARFVRAVAEAVAHAHAHGIVHRDLKPENVLFTEDGVPKVADFGLARGAGNRGLTATNTVMGTPDYMAPEQARGDSGRSGPAVDVWALGAILYRLVAGRPPFQAATGVDTLRLVLDAEPVPLRSLVPGCPKDLETVALKCLEKSPGRRYASAQELADDLGRFLEGRPVQARPVSSVERAAKWVRRNPVVAALAATVAATLLAAAVVSGLLAWWATAAADLADARRVAAEQAEGRAREAATREAAARTELAAELRRSRSSRFSLQLARLAPLLESGSPQVREQLLDGDLFPPDLRDPAWGLLWAWSRRGEWSLPRHDGRPGGPLPAEAFAFDPTGRVLARARPGVLEFLDAHSGRVLRRARPLDGAPARLAFSHEGRWLYGLDGTALYQWEADTGRFVRRWALAGEGFLHLCLAPTGDEALVAGQHGRAWSIPLRDGGEPRVLAEEASALALSDDGTTLAVGGREVALIDRASGRSVALRPAGPVWAPPRCLAFAPGGRLLAAGHGDGVLRLWDVATRRELFALPPRARRLGVGAVAFHPSLPLLAAVHETTLIVHAVGDGGALLSRPAQPLSPFAAVPLCFRPDGREVLYLGPEATPTLIDPTDRLATFAIDLPGGGHFAYRGDGSLVVLGGNGSSAFHDGASGTLLATGPPVPAGVLQVVAAPAGGRLAVLVHPDRVELRRLATGEVLNRFTVPGPAHTLAATRDGAFVAVARTADAGATVAVYEAISGRLCWEEAVAEPVSALACDPDGLVLAVARPHSRRVVFHDVRTGKEARSPLAVGGQPDRLLWLGDGSLLCVEAGRLVLREAGTGREVRRLGGAPLQLRALAASPDGRTLATADTERRLRLWDLPTGQLRHTWPLPGDPAAAPGLVLPMDLAFGPDGDRLALRISTTTGVVLQGFRTPWRDAPLALTADEPITDAAFSPSGERLATAGDSGVVVWSRTTGRPLGGKLPGDAEPTRIGFLDEERLLVEDRTGRRQIWDLATRQPLEGPAPELPPRPEHPRSADGWTATVRQNRLLLRPPGDADTREATAELHRRLAEPLLRDPWDPTTHERLVPVLAEQGQAGRAALHLAWSLWLRHGPR